MRLRTIERWSPANTMIAVCVLTIVLIGALANALFVPTLGAWILVGLVGVVLAVASTFLVSIMRRGRDVQGEPES